MARRGRKRGPGRPKKRSRRMIGPKSPGPVALLARKVQGLNTRVHGLESEIGLLPGRFVTRKQRHAKLGNLEERGKEYWASGE
jgi:hypothetical protein